MNIFKDIHYFYLLRIKSIDSVRIKMCGSKITLGFKAVKADYYGETGSVLYMH